MSQSQNGWPVYAQGNDSDLVAIPKIIGRVRKGDVAWIFTDFVNRFDRTVEDVDAGKDEWGWAARPVRGYTSIISNHASGTALDINAVQHGIGLEGTFTAKQEATIRSLMKRYKGAIRWGGDYDDRKDEMHFEINVTPAKLAQIVNALRNPVTVVPTKAPVKKPVAKATPKPSEAVEKVQRQLRVAGYYTGTIDGIAGPMYASSIKKYQTAQRSPFKLVADGKWGPTTQRHFEWVKSLQAAMNKWYVPSGAKLFVDGDYGVIVVSRVKALMTRHKGVRYKGRVDGNPGALFCKMIGINPHP